jgi:hypothetical protein
VHAGGNVGDRQGVNAKQRWISRRSIGSKGSIPSAPFVPGSRSSARTAGSC